MRSWADIWTAVVRTLRAAEAVTEGLTLEVKEQMDADKEWLDNPAVVEQSCAFHRPVMLELGEAPVPISGQEGLFYRAEGMPYLRLRFANAADVQIESAESVIRSWRRIRISGRWICRWIPAFIM